MRKSLLCALVIISAHVFALTPIFADEPAGGTYYTKCNIWHEEPGKIYSSNYRKGQFLPLGTKVTIVSVGKEKKTPLGLDKITPFTGEKIVFVDDDNGVTYTLVQVHQHTRISLGDYFNRMFSKTDPKSSGGDFDKLTEEEKEHVLKGTIARGMSKNAVIMAIGYPPSHKTPSLKNNTWLYWYDRFNKDKIFFKDDKIISVVK